ncbi:MAG: class I SAM-dependent methyltransferase [Armatimonadetes bacterium]|nr:class I SAM-dependent methyltransferase [Armatimonadota bacterium]MDE2206893.1 class I SAM-dependent methyltransferase [Armatimonadota bacterium]
MPGLHKLHKPFRKLRAAAKTWKPPACDHTVTVNDLLYSDIAGAVQLPTFEQKSRSLGRYEEDLEFASASLLERLALGALVRRHAPMTLFEIGTFRGVTALTMALNAPEGFTLYTLDLPQELTFEQVVEQQYARGAVGALHRMVARGVERRQVGLAYRNRQLPGKIEQLFGDSTTMDFAPWAAQIDSFFVDGCHDAEPAYRDTQTAWSCLKPGGMIIWHDYRWRSVQAGVQRCRLPAPITWVQDTSVAFAYKPQPVGANGTGRDGS